MQLFKWKDPSPKTLRFKNPKTPNKTASLSSSSAWWAKKLRGRAFPETLRGTKPEGPSHLTMKGLVKSHPHRYQKIAA